MKITINTSTEIIGGPEWSPELRISLADGSVYATAAERHSSENSVSFDEYRRRTLVWTNCLPRGAMVIASPDAIANLVEAIKPLLERVAAGHTVEWDGSNMVGRLSDDALEASEEIDQAIADCDWVSDIHVEGAGDWLVDYDLPDGISEEDLPDIADQLEAEARADGIELVDTLQHLEFLFSDRLAQSEDED